MFKRGLPNSVGLKMSIHEFESMDRVKEVREQEEDSFGRYPMNTYHVDEFIGIKPPNHLKMVKRG
jgi:hypothetical protein